MAIKKKTVGTGITEKVLTTYSGEDMKKGLDNCVSNWNAAWDEGGGQFGAVTLRWRIIADAIREDFQEEYPARDTLPWFADQIIKHHNIVCAAIERNDIQTASRFGFDLGRIVSEFQMKCAWEEYALRGKRDFQNKSSGGDMTSAKHRPNRQLIIAKMKDVVSAGHSVTNAARLVFERGFGTSPEANRKLWTRHRKD